MRVLVVNWQDRENPFAGGAEIHLHEIFGRLAARGHEVTLLCSGWGGAPQRTHDSTASPVHRVGTRYTFQLLARRVLSARACGRGIRCARGRHQQGAALDAALGREPHGGAVPHLFGTTAFQELPAPLAAAVWLQERPIGRVYGATPFEAISESTADDLAARGIPRERIAVIHPGIDTAAYTPAPAERSPGAARRLSRTAQAVQARRPDHSGLCGDAGIQRHSSRLRAPATFDRRSSVLPPRLTSATACSFLGSSPSRRKWRCSGARGCSRSRRRRRGGGSRISRLPHAPRRSLHRARRGCANRCGMVRRAFSCRMVISPRSCNALRRIVNDPSLVASLGEAARRFASRFTWEAAAEQTEAHLESVIAARVA